jgi:hypothetical protein
MAVVVWVEGQKWKSRWAIVVVDIGSVAALLGARKLGARLMRKLDWKKYGT